MKPLSVLAISGGLLHFASPAVLAAGQTVFSFPPTDLQLWTQVVVPGANGTDRQFYATGSTFGNRISWADPVGGAGGVVVTSPEDTDSRDGAHNTAVLRSPTFTLAGSNPAAGLGDFSPTDIRFKLLAGMGSATGPAHFADLPAVSADNAGNVAYLGLGLRRVSDDAYLLWGHRSSNAQGTAWETVIWDAATLAGAIAGDAPGTLYTLDLIDAAHGSWGWMAMDSLTMVDENSVVNASVRNLDLFGAETGGDQDLSVRFTRTGSLGLPLTLTFTLEGTAVESLDFQELPNYIGPDYAITFPAGQATVDLPIHILNNGTAEVDRSLRVRILESGNDDYVVTEPSMAQLWISDLPTDSGLVTASGPFPTGTYLPIPNPFTAGAAGSLFIYGEATHANGFLVLGIRGVAADNSINGGVDFGRNNASAGLAIFNYLDNKGAASATARVAAPAEVPIQPGGHYTMIGEIEMHADQTGTLRAWVWDGAAGTLDFANPYLETSFSHGFTGLGEQIYLRLDGVGGAGNSWTNGKAVWVDGADAAAREAAFHSLTPTRPFLYATPGPAAGEFGPDREVVFDVFRTGAPKGALAVPLEFFGTASAGDFSTPLPTSANFEDGQSSIQYRLEIAPDDLYEGSESTAIELESTLQWLVPLERPSATLLDRPFQGWMATTLPGSSQGGDEDFDGDGWVNLLEYFSGTLPGSASSRSATIIPPGEPATLRFQRDPLASDVDAKVLWSTDLTAWHASGESDGTRTIAITEQVVGTSDSGIETVDAKAEVTGDKPAKLFLKLSVELR